MTTTSLAIVFYLVFVFYGGNETICLPVEDYPSKAACDVAGAAYVKHVQEGGLSAITWACVEGPKDSSRVPA